MFDQTVITNVGYSYESGNAVLASGVADSSPMGALPRQPRFATTLSRQRSLQPMDFATFYGSGAKSIRDTRTIPHDAGGGRRLPLSGIHIHDLYGKFNSYVNIRRVVSTGGAFTWSYVNWKSQAHRGER